MDATSPYLNLPLRSLAQALADRAAAEWKASGSQATDRALRPTHSCYQETRLHQPGKYDTSSFIRT